jgi:hypothetical protein
MNIFDHLIRMLAPLASEEYTSPAPEEELEPEELSAPAETEDEEDSLHENEGDDLYSTHYKDND